MSLSGTSRSVFGHQTLVRICVAVTKTIPPTSFIALFLPSPVNKRMLISSAFAPQKTPMRVLAILTKDIPVDLAKYAKDNDLFDQLGWKRFQRLARREVHLTRLIRQARLCSFCTSQKYKYGYQLPNNHEHALELDRLAGNTEWTDANDLEHKQLLEYKVFIDKGKFIESNIPKGYQQKRIHTVYDVKHDFQHKVRIVARGDLTPTPTDSVYSGEVSLRGLRTCIFLGKLNGMTPWATDIGNAYLKAKTCEKVCIRAGPEFGNLSEHLLIINKALQDQKQNETYFYKNATIMIATSTSPCMSKIYALS
jgi:hypothetical protein